MTMRFADAFAADIADVCDAHFLLSCTCGYEQRLDAMDLDDFGGVTLYDCVRCANTVAVIMADDAATRLWLSGCAMTRGHEPSGHRRNGFVIGGKVDVSLRPPGAVEDLLFVPATPNLFVALRNL